MKYVCVWGGEGNKFEFGSQVGRNIKRSQVTASFVNCINLHFSFPTSKRHRNGDPWWSSFHLDENKLVGELAFLNSLATTPSEQQREQKMPRGSCLRNWTSRKRVYIDQQIPLVSPLNIYREQEARVKPLSWWLCANNSVSILEILQSFLHNWRLI